MSLSSGQFPIGLQWGTLKIPNSGSPGGIFPKFLWVTPRVNPRHVTKLQKNRFPNKKFGTKVKFANLAMHCRAWVNRPFS